MSQPDLHLVLSEMQNQTFFAAADQGEILKLFLENI